MDHFITSIILAGFVALGGMASAIGPGALSPTNGESDLGILYLTGDQNEPRFGRKYVTIQSPAFHPVHETELDDSELVIGLSTPTGNWCFPIRIMAYHHVVDVIIDGEKNSLTYCAMANSVVVFKPLGSFGGSKYPVELQVAGSYSGTLVLTENYILADPYLIVQRIYPQLNPSAPLPNSQGGGAVPLGPPAVIAEYGSWRRKYPETLVLQPDPKFADKYAEYDAKPKGYSILRDRDRTIKMRDKRLSPGREVFGVAMGQNSVAWTLEEIKHRKQIYEPLNGELIHIAWDQELDAPVVVNPPKDIIATRCYWYSWSSFYPGGPLNGKFAVEGDIAAVPPPVAEESPKVVNTSNTTSGSK